MRKNKRLTEKQLTESGRSLIAQKHMMENAEKVTGKVKKDLNKLSALNDSHSDELDTLLAQAEKMVNHENEYKPEIIPKTFERIEETEYEALDSISNSDHQSWEAFMVEIDDYLAKHHVTVSADPFEDLLTEQERIELTKQVREDYKMESANCDKYDYMIAAFSGVAAGVIDAVFVGMPGDSKLGNWSDAQIDNVVIKLSKQVWHFDKKNGANLKKEPDSIASAIGFLERRFRVNYDARYPSDLYLNEDTLNMSARNHHLKSLGHSPDIIGLIFSILDQFTGKASFISDAEVIRAVPVEGNTTFELQGGNFIAKLFAGFANWLGHLLSDIAGSSGTRGHMDGRRGSGIPLPFYSLLQLFDFGTISTKKDNILFHQTIAEFSTSVFEAGYDFRHGVAMSIPVVMNELMIRLLWGLKSKFYHQKSWEESIPIGKKPKLRRMLLVGHGSLCIVDGTDSFFRSAGSPLLFTVRLNAVAWSRFAFAGLLEVRSIYKENSVDLVALEKDLEREWERLF